VSNCSLWFQRYHPHLGDVIIDIGAGDGEDLAEMSTGVGPAGRVIAFEAHSGFCSIAKSAATRLENVTLMNLAITGADGPFYVDESEEWEATTVSSERTPVCVPGRRLDGILEELGVTRNIAFLKMNIEGGEREALPGAVETLRNTRVACICAHDFRAHRGEGKRYITRDFVRQFLIGLGFPKIESVPGWDHVHAWRNA